MQYGNEVACISYFYLNVFIFYFSFVLWVYDFCHETLATIVFQVIDLYKLLCVCSISLSQLKLKRTWRICFSIRKMTAGLCEIIHDVNSGSLCCNESGQINDECPLTARVVAWRC